MNFHRRPRRKMNSFMRIQVMGANRGGTRETAMLAISTPDIDQPLPDSRTDELRLPFSLDLRLIRL